MDLSEEESTKMYLKSSGQRYLLTNEGLAIFEQLLAQEAVQHLVVAGQENKVKRFLGLQQPQPENQKYRLHSSVGGRGTTTGNARIARGAMSGVGLV